MLAYELIEKLTSTLGDFDLKESSKAIFAEAIKKLQEFGNEKVLSGKDVIEVLNLEKIPAAEAGYFYEYQNTNPEALGAENKKSTQEESNSKIFYLMNEEQTSCLHSLNTTETWHWVGGSDILLYICPKGETVQAISLNKENPEHTIEKGVLFGAKNSDSTSFGLVICECKPGFIFAHYNHPTSKEITELNKDPLWHSLETLGDPKPQDKLELESPSEQPQTLAPKPKDSKVPASSGIFKNPAEPVKTDKIKPEKSNNSCSIL